MERMILLERKCQDLKKENDKKDAVYKRLKRKLEFNKIKEREQRPKLKN